MGALLPFPKPSARADPAPLPPTLWRGEVTTGPRLPHVHVEHRADGVTELRPVVAPTAATAEDLVRRMNEIMFGLFARPEDFAAWVAAGERLAAGGPA